jgi:luciferase-like monooxygenase
MRFGHFFYPMNFDAARDYQVITDCLAEAALVEHPDLDAIWIAEHHFTGETVYGDAVIFAAALAVKTQRSLLGFCQVVEAETLIRGAGALPRFYSPFRRLTPCLSLRPNS